MIERYEPARRDWLELWGPSVELAKAIAQTDFVPKSFRGNPALIAAAILYGDEVGLGPMQSLAKISIIDGKPSLAAEAQRALILAAGHDLWVEEATNTRVTVAGRRKDGDKVVPATWTMDDAKRAGIAGKQAWRQYPRAMLLARATAELARSIFADAIGGLAATEELEDRVEGSPEISSPESAPSSTTRRRRSSKALAVAPPPEDDEPPAASAVPAEPGPGSGPTSDQAEPEPEPELMTDLQRPKLMALFNENGFKDRDERMAFTRVLIGRPLESSLELTKDEASHVIEVLEHRLANVKPGEDALLQELKETLDARESE